MAQNVLSNDYKSAAIYRKIEAIKTQSINNSELIKLNDMGAGSKVHKNNTRSISHITKSTAIPDKFGRLLHRLIQWGNVKNVLELGTGTGISTAYMLAALDDNSKLLTIEGAEALIPFAKRNTENLDSNVEVNFISGNFDTELEDVLKQLNKVDLVLMDGNHKKESTLRYFKQISPYLHPESIVILDDIRWSKDMLQAWQEIRHTENVTCSIDLFRMGLLFFKKELLKPQHISYKY